MSAILERIPATALATRVIASVDAGLAAALGLNPQQTAIAMLTTDCDDVGYIAVDEATKKANVEVVYAASVYAGAAHASGPFSGEFIGILASDNPADASAGLRAAVEFTQNDAAFEKAAPGGPAFLAHLVSSCGTYLAAAGGIPVGTALAYLIAPPLEATFGLDAALKAADVKLIKHFPPPSETNFSGGWLAGSQAACQAACDAFRDAVVSVAVNPMTF